MAPVKRPAWLLTTHRRVAVAVGVMAFFFALSVPDELHPARRSSSWVFPDGIPHRWVAIAFDLAPYIIFCLMAFEAIRATKGRERLFMVGVLLSFMPSPLTTLRPQWAVPVGDLEFFGITVSLIAALSLLLFPEVVGKSDNASG